ncbi:MULTISPECIES: MarR family winged helix-turn-helix transcriptional regulator [unclassified Sphingomonas]|uniref:MarR family winged helix-turn-helix transcriptional regulator n=1 Tax=Sphingomonas TaxID=13687 RepID=UPI002857D2DA|nr:MULTISPECIES: MarR family transcriptional regulator [unclassified Sphingomonas]MDR6116273.1 DNA-binding MarR family transcriptional regulator [Sphingomonas sp. SORGH_AS_0789]MDR6150052.1 DNA-binding MarR family transcriptional regulator [Sphingomonas sp. SORGH_AS_0742]
MDDDVHASAVRLQILATRMLRLARSSHADHKLTSAQFSALSVLRERGTLPLGEVARAERVSHPTMSRIISGLAQSGFVERVGGSSDKRVRHVALTAEGRTLYEQVAANRIAIMETILTQLTPATRADVIAVVARVVKGIEEHLDQN